MYQRVLLSLGNGSLQQGFASVRVEIQREDASFQSLGKQIVRLPPSPELADYYRDWKLLYDAYQSQFYYQKIPNYRGITIEERGLTNFSRSDFEVLSVRLKQEIDRWFDQAAFRKAKEMLMTILNPQDEIRFILETDDPLLWRLPWNQWQFFEQYPQAELSLTPLQSKPLAYKTYSKNHRLKQSPKVHILAILGDSGGIDLQPDIQSIQSLSYASIRFLFQPSRPELNEALWSQDWDILFFAGHSQSGLSQSELNQTHDRAEIFLSTTESLTIPELRHALQQAIDRGLQLAIFNSCDGIGLAQNLAALNLPHGIVMREAVPDRIAQIFLKYFLEFFSAGSTLSYAVRQARLRLQGYQTEFPQASWLPVLFEHPRATVLSWADWNLSSMPDLPNAFPDSLSHSTLPSHSHSKPNNLGSFRRFRSILIPGFLTMILLGIRQLGLLQPFEWMAFDRMMRSLPVEGVDDRLLVIEITEEDLQFQTDRKMQRQGSLSDEALSNVLTELSAHRPAAIGINVYHDFPLNPNIKKLPQQLKEIENIFMICRHSDPFLSFPGTPALPGFSPNQVGFSDVIEDRDGVLRRQIFSMTPNLDTPCKAEESLSLQIALKYLEKQSKNITLRHDLKTEMITLGNRKLPLIQKHWGIYQGIDNAGYQMMLNYRFPQVSRSLTLRQILQREFNPNWIENKIILIGVTAPTVKDFQTTPYSQTRQINQKMAGVFIQAQMVSQLISGVLDRRPWIDVLPLWLEGLWILVWCLGCHWMIYRSRLLQSAIFLTILISVGLWTVCWISLSFLGILLPIVPTEFAIVGVSFFEWVDRRRLQSSSALYLPAPSSSSESS